MPTTTPLDLISIIRPYQPIRFLKDVSRGAYAPQIVKRVSVTSQMIMAGNVTLATAVVMVGWTITQPMDTALSSTGQAMAIIIAFTTAHSTATIETSAITSTMPAEFGTL